MTERTLILIKPDGVARGLSGEILRRVEAKGYVLVALRLETASEDLLAVLPSTERFQLGPSTPVDLRGKDLSVAVRPVTR